MKMHHFFINQKLITGRQKIEDDDLIHQLKDVLKFIVGEKIILADGLGQEAEAEILEINRKYLLIELGEIKNANREAGNKTILYCAILKGDNFEWAVQKAIECGASKIVPLVTERTIKNKINFTRLKKIIKEAAEQSERSFLPELVEPLILKQAIQESQTNDLNILFDPKGEEISNQIKKSRNKKIGIFIGPEGGWTEPELALSKNSGLLLVSLGKTILRGETAAAVGIYLAGFIF